MLGRFFTHNCKYKDDCYKLIIYHSSSLDKDDSINGSSKTQSAATTESNTPENTVRLDNMSHKASHNYHIENNEVVLERKF